jgi:hypothetical protein
MGMARALLSVMALVFCVGFGARASSGESDDIGRARALFGEAEKLRQQGDHSAAAERLRRAIEIKDTPGLRFHLAHTLERLDQFRAARIEYERAQALIGAGVKAPDVEVLLDKALDALDARTPTLEVRVDLDVHGLRVRVDGEDVEPGAPTRFDPGRHEVVASADNHAEFSRTVDLAEGARRVVEAALVPIEQTVTSADERRGVTAAESGGSGGRTAVLIGELGVVAVGLGFGIFETIAANDAHDRATRYDRSLDERAPGDPTVCTQPTSTVEADCEGLVAALDDRDRARTLALAGYVAAGVGALAFVGTFLLWPSESGAPARDAGGIPRVRVTGDLGPGRVVASVSGAF